ncbi:MAG: hypothetical protein LBU61_03280, partial [Coriobacteriales bacterium]|nr:hypothetical protein [Coriobacteriales bacterium]
LLSEEILSEDLCLYWADVELTAPDTSGNYQWEARLPETSLSTPLPPEVSLQENSQNTIPNSDTDTCVNQDHPEAVIRFNFTVIQAAKHLLTIEIVGQDTQAAPGRTRVMLLPYRGYADENGVYSVKVAPGTYKLLLVADRYENYEIMLDINADTKLRAELEPSEYETDYRGNVYRVEKKAD